MGEGGGLRTQHYIDGDALEKCAGSLDPAQCEAGPVLAITDAALMRGVDFRAPLQGITLYVCASLTNKREAQQALGRVGRNGDACRRYLLEGADLVDATAQASYIGALVAYYTRTQKRTLPKLDFAKNPPKKKERIEKEAKENVRIDRMLQKKAQDTRGAAAGGAQGARGDSVGPQ